MRYQLSYANDRQSRHLNDISREDLDALRRLLMGLPSMAEELPSPPPATTP